MSGKVEHCCSVGAELGEGPCWSASGQQLWFVDIKGLRIYRFTPSDGKLDSWAAPAQPGWVFPAEDGRMIAGLQSGIHAFDPDDGSFHLLAAPESAIPGNRLNDAATDSSGNIWFSSMDDGESQPTGRVYRLTAGHVTETAIPPCAIVNGPALSPDGRTLYHVDTLGGTIDAYDLGETGFPGAFRRLVTFDLQQGYPDGPTVDSEGCIWIGLWGGWCAHRYSSGGELIDKIEFPVANVTKVAFGGPDLRAAYATTAHKGLTPAERATQPLAGDLFTFRTEVPGLPATKASSTN